VKPKARWPAVVFCFGAIACYVWFCVVSLYPRTYNNDFKHMYLGMKALLDGSEPYSGQSLFHQAALNDMRGVSLNPYVYLPFTGLTLAFLAPFSFKTAASIWFSLNHVLAVVSCLLAVNAMFPRRRFTAFSTMLLIMSFCHPHWRTITAGQLNLVLLAILAASYYLLCQGRGRWAAGLLAFAACFKIAPAIFLVYFLLRRQWESFLVMGGVMTILLMASAAVVGLGVHWEFFSVLRHMGYGKSTWPEAGMTFWKDSWNQSPNSLFSHLFTRSEGIVPWADLGQGVANLITVGGSVILMSMYALSCWNRKPVMSRQQGFDAIDQAAYHATILMMLLAPSLMWDHYLVMALLPSAWLVDQAIQKKSWNLGILTAALVIFISIPWNFDSPAFRGGPGLILMSMKLFPVLILFVICCGFAGLYDRGLIASKEFTSGQIEQSGHT
jgi:alpha-1,2-mannosyltransferase